MSDEDKAYDNYRYFEYCRANGHDPYLLRTETGLNFFIGNQWTAEEKAQMRESGRPALTINQFFRDMDSIVGEMIYATGDVRFAPTDTAFEDVSDVLQKTYLSVTGLNKLEYIEPRVLFMGMLSGRGYFRVRTDFNDQMQGNVCITAPRPQNVILHPEIDDPDPKTWPEVFTTRFMSLDQIALTYGDAASKEIEATPQADWLSPYDSFAERQLSQQLNGGIFYDPSNGDPRLLRCRRLVEREYRALKYKNFFVDPDTGDMSEVPENWDRERIGRLMQLTGVEVIKRRTQTIRWTVSCDRFLLHDADSPYNELTLVPFFPYFVDGYTLGLGDQLIDLQRFTNKLYSQELHILNSAANSGWKVKQGSLQNMTEEELERRGAETGLTAVLKDVDDLERIEPGALPSGHDHLAQTLDGKFHQISGYNEAMAGAPSTEATGDALSNRVQRGSVNLATASKALYFTKTLLAERIRDQVQTFYTETRLLHYTNPATNETEPFTVNQPTPEGRMLNNITTGKYAVTVTPAPSRDTVQQTVFDQLKAMRLELGIAIPDEVMLQYSSLPQKAAVSQAIKDGSGDQSAQQQQQRLQQALLQAELAAKQAASVNSAAQADLAHARAAKALADSQRDPNAQRLALDRERLALEHARDTQRMAQDREQSDRDTALALTDMHLQHRRDLAKSKEAATQES